MWFIEKFESKQVLKCVLDPRHFLFRETGAVPEWPSPWRTLQVGKMLEERRPLVSSRTEPAPVPNVQVHLLERRGSARQLRRAPLPRPRLSEPEELVGKSVA